MSTMAETISNAMEQLMEAAAGDITEICTDASKYSLSDWRALQITKATSVGAAAAAVPVYSYLTLPADVVATLRIMHRCAIGICHLLLGYADQEAFAGVLGVWSGEVTLDNTLAKQIAAKTLATSATTVGGQVGLKLSIKAFNLCTSAIVAKKLGPKVAQKVAAKLSAKLAAKATTRWIPIISAGVGGYANFYITNGIAESAEQYARFIRNIPDPPLLPQPGVA